MPRVSAPTAPSPRIAISDAGPVALIADEECARARIAEVLELHGIECVALESVEALAEHLTTETTLPVVMLLAAAEASPSAMIERFRQVTQQAPLVVVRASMERWDVRAALAAGANGVVLDENLADALVPCLLAVTAGQICVPQPHWRQVEPPALSTREKQILGLVVMGYMNGQIAEQLFLAESTVKSHLSSAFGKLGVRSRNEAVSLILDSKRGLGTGILALHGERLETTATGGG